MPAEEAWGPVWLYPDIPALQKKIALAGEMKTAIKSFLDWQEHHDQRPAMTREGKSKVRALRKAMENYLNAG